MAIDFERFRSLLQNAAADANHGGRISSHRLLRRLRFAPVFLLVAGIGSFAAYSSFRAPNQPGGDGLSDRMRTRTHILDDPETAAFAPSEFRARFDRRGSRMGVLLTWSPTADDARTRIYRIPSGTSPHIEVDGRPARTFDAEVVPGRAYTYVACVYTEQGHEYCSDPIRYEVPGGNWR